MQTATMTQGPTSPLKFLFWIVAIAALILAGTAISHGVAKHGETAQQIRQCISNGGTFQVWENPTTGRRANVCEYAPLTFGIQIIQKFGDAWEEITAFHNKSRNIESVMQYLRNAGYELLP